MMRKGNLWMLSVCCVLCMQCVGEGKVVEIAPDADGVKDSASRLSEGIAEEGLVVPVDSVPAKDELSPDLLDVAPASPDISLDMTSALDILEDVLDHIEAVDSGPDQVDVVDSFIEIVDTHDSSDGLLDTLDSSDGPLDTLDSSDGPLDTLDSSDGLLDTLDTGDVCIPDCDGIKCGDDGCGETCGECVGQQEQCVDGQCECQPDCEGKQCGDDGCGGLCGECAGENDLCVEGQCNCIPSCACIECGDDGCGGSCGACVGETDCHLGECVFGVCVYTVAEDAGCCVADSDCEDGDVCTNDGCFQNSCVHLPNQYCCHIDEDCTVYSQCWKGVCDIHTCQRVALSLTEQQEAGLECCEGDQECAEGGAWEEDSDGDGKAGPDNPATVDVCSEGICKHVGLDACECSVSADCGEEWNDNIECVDGCACRTDYSELCLADFECEDSVYCTVSFCNVGVGCKHAVIGCCCGSDMACWDGNPCTVNECAWPFGCCTQTWIDGCCNYINKCSDCDDSTEDLCVKGKCVYVPIGM